MIKKTAIHSVALGGDEDNNLSLRNDSGYWQETEVSARFDAFSKYSL